MTVRSVLLIAALAACGPKAAISESRMAYAPSLPENCQLELVQVDITAVQFNQQWEVLGYVTLLDTKLQDPAAPENRALVRPRACAMGGSSVAVAMSSAATNQLGQQGSGVVYMVLRPKAWSQGPTKF